jgi:sulfur-carrier protein
VIRVVLPAHLKSLAKVHGEVSLSVEGSVTAAAVLDALERDYPVLRGTIRDSQTGKRRAFVRYYACEQDLSHEDPDTALPEAVVSGQEPFIVLGAMAGG